MQQSRLLIVDDDRDMREALGNLFSSEGHTCELAADATAALDIADVQTFDVVICDVLMEGMTGLELLDRFRRTHPALPFIVITGEGGIHQAVDAIKRGAFEYMVKPCDANDLRRVVTDALDDRRHPMESVRLAPPPSTVGLVELVGSGPAMRALHKRADEIRSGTPMSREQAVVKIAERAREHERPARLQPNVVLRPAPQQAREHDDQRGGHGDEEAVGAVAQPEGRPGILDVGQLEKRQHRHRPGEAQFPHRPKLRRPIGGEDG